jgi:hypothetical protein
MRPARSRLTGILGVISQVKNSLEEDKKFGCQEVRFLQTDESFQQNLVVQKLSQNRQYFFPNFCHKNIFRYLRILEHDNECETFQSVLVSGFLGAWST